MYEIISLYPVWAEDFMILSIFVVGDQSFLKILPVTQIIIPQKIQTVQFYEATQYSSLLLTTTSLSLNTYFICPLIANKNFFFFPKVTFIPIIIILGGRIRIRLASFTGHGVRPTSSSTHELSMQKYPGFYPVREFSKQ